ncbi:MAG: Bug family tripartite tricarboxylate transporter substrate binding protein, partial [Burkholderiaceae bacterium]
MERRRALTLGLGTAALALAARPATVHAQATRFPDRPVKLIVPYSPGGGGDTLARQLAPRLADRLGVQVVVENRPGAGGNLGTEAGLKAPADGYTLVAISASYPCQAIVSKLSFDPLVDYTPITLVSREPGILIVNPDFPAKSLRELIELAKARPGTLAYGSAGHGSQAHFNTEYMAYRAGIRLNHVPYKGTSQAFNDMLGGNIQLMFATPQF